jgi:hypothetical protein
MITITSFAEKIRTEPDFPALPSNTVDDSDFSRIRFYAFIVKILHDHSGSEAVQKTAEWDSIGMPTSESRILSLNTLYCMQLSSRPKPEGFSAPDRFPSP